MTQIVDWNKRKWNLLQNCTHEYNAFQDLLVLTLKTCLKIVIASINYLLNKKKLFEALIKCKNIFHLCF